MVIYEAETETHRAYATMAEAVAEAKNWLKSHPDLDQIEIEKTIVDPSKWTIVNMINTCGGSYAVSSEVVKIVRAPKRKED